MTEQEPERLRRALNRVLDAHQDALDTIRRALEYGDEEEQALEDIEARQWRPERFEEALVDVLDILDGATQDVRNILEEGVG